MDLTKTAPRSVKEKMDGIYSLARSLDKARAFNAGTLGEYHYNCPHDKPLFAFLGTDDATFAEHARDDDATFAAWVSDTYLSKKTPAEIDAFNAKVLAWKPEPGTESATYFNDLRSQIAPERTDVTTWPDLLDLDEGRQVAASV